MPSTNDKWYSGWLRSAAKVYRKSVRARRESYEYGPRPQLRLPRPVISVGNLTVGGSGKTPTVIYLCNNLSTWGHVAVLSRGYGRKSRFSKLTLPEARRLDERAPLFFGDEPVMMAHNLENTSIHVGPRRYQTGLHALAGHPVDLFILDDGFQHLELHRDLDIVLINGKENISSLELLPAGTLREPLETLRRADVLIINNCSLNGEHVIDEKELRILAPKAPISKTRYQVSGLFDLSTGLEISKEELADHPLFAFCAIGSPQNFLDTLSELDLNVVGNSFFQDHRYFKGRDLANIERAALSAGAARLITTEKDAVRIQADKIRGLPIVQVKVELKFVEGEEAFWEKVGAILDVG